MVIWVNDRCYLHGREGKMSRIKGSIRKMTVLQSSRVLDDKGWFEIHSMEE